MVDIELEKKYARERQEEELRKRTRILPRSDADFNLLMTDTVWGSNQINSDIKDKVSRLYYKRAENGKIEIEEEKLWGLLGFFTRDMRLGNISPSESEYCRYYLDLANDFLQVNMVEPFIICLERTASVLELSQSKKGFLRRRMNTVSTESSYMDEPKKKTLFGMGKGRD